MVVHPRPWDQLSGCDARGVGCLHSYQSDYAAMTLEEEGFQVGL